MKVFFSVGEPSGDLHGANLIKELRQRAPRWQFVGYGGPKMKMAGCDLHEDLTRFAVMWFLRVLTNIGTFWNLLCRADRYFRHHRPDAVVLIDYPGFNWWIARRAKAHGIPVFYYGTPQMWAWAGWRVKKMRRFVDHVLCKLAFEVDWYQERGCTATFVGHPYFDELINRPIDEEFVGHVAVNDDPLVVILPGSRTQEVLMNLSCFLDSAKIIRKRLPRVRFAIASFNKEQAALATETLKEQDFEADVYVGKTPELIEAATCCLACSGSVSLELLYHTKPAVIHYRIGKIPFFVQRYFRKVRYITLANLLATNDRYCRRGETYDPKVDAERVPFPEYLTSVDKSNEMAQHIVTWLTDPKSYQAVSAQLQSLKERFAIPGASKNAASYILDQFSDKPVSDANCKDAAA